MKSPPIDTGVLLELVEIYRVNSAHQKAVREEIQGLAGEEVVAERHAREAWVKLRAYIDDPGGAAK